MLTNLNINQLSTLAQLVELSSTFGAQVADGDPRQRSAEYVVSSMWSAYVIVAFEGAVVPGILGGRLRWLRCPVAGERRRRNRQRELSVHVAGCGSLWTVDFWSWAGVLELSVVVC